MSLASFAHPSSPPAEHLLDAPPRLGLPRLAFVLSASHIPLVPLLLQLPPRFYTTAPSSYFLARCFYITDCCCGVLKMHSG